MRHTVKEGIYAFEKNLSRVKKSLPPHLTDGFTPIFQRRMTFGAIHFCLSASNVFIDALLNTNQVDLKSDHLGLLLLSAAALPSPNAAAGEDESSLEEKKINRGVRFVIEV
ncbi:hypothetical protein ACLOJK_023177 [Asimina triloba]